MIEYCGNPIPTVIECGGPNGPYQVIKPAEGALILLRAPKFSEQDRVDLMARINGQPGPAPVPAPAPSGGDSTGARLGRLVDAIEADLANDGQIDEHERQQLLGLALAELGAPAVVKDLVSGAIDPLGTAKQILSGIRGIF